MQQTKYGNGDATYQAAGGQGGIRLTATVVYPCGTRAAGMHG